MPTQISLEKIGKVIQRSKPEEQRNFLRHLPHLLSIEGEDWSWLKTSESAFAFWDNQYDERYNNL